MERMETMLYEAAVKGSVSTLLELLQQDPLILDKEAMNDLSESPLHIEALLGHVDFVREILRRKPQLAGELDTKRSSALHKASHKGYADVVHAFLHVNTEMCFVRDADGRNTLLLAAMRGRIDVLEELVRGRPLAASTTTILGETILHLCLKHNQMEALKFLVKKMDDPEFLNAKIDYGMTILHLAVADKQTEAIEFLTNSTIINVNALNANGFTVLDILAQSHRDIRDWEVGELLRRAEAISANNIHLSTDEHEQTNNCMTSHENNPKKQAKDLENYVPKKEDDWLERKRNALMVVALLIATMAFQVGVNPPHSRLQDTSSQDTAFTTVSDRPSAYRDHIHSFESLFVYNTTGFLASLSIILLLISGLPLTRRIFMWILMVIMWVAITAMAMTYTVCINFLVDPRGYYEWYSSPSAIVIFVWIGTGVILFLGHSTRLTVKMRKYIKKSFRRPSRIQTQDVHQPRISSIL